MLVHRMSLNSCRKEKMKLINGKCMHGKEKSRKKKIKKRVI